METNVVRWCFHTTSTKNENSITFYIENNPLTLFVGYRRMDNALLYWCDFYAFIKCLLILKYFKISVVNLNESLMFYDIKNNVMNMKFKKDEQVSPYVLLDEDGEVYNLCNVDWMDVPECDVKVGENCLPMEEFKKLCDISLIERYLKVYFRQKNLSLFNTIITSLIDEWNGVYMKLAKNACEIEFYSRILPNVREFYLYSSVIEYAASIVLNENGRLP